MFLMDARVKPAYDDSAGHLPLLRLLHQPRRRGLHVVFETLQESLLVETGRNGIENLDAHRAGIALERAPAPEEAGIERHRQARHASLGIEVGDAALVGRRS